MALMRGKLGLLAVKVPHADQPPNARRCYMALMRSKLGLLAKQEDADFELVSELLEAMRTTGSDFTNTFRLLASFPMASDSAAGGEKRRLEEGGISISDGGGVGGRFGGGEGGEHQDGSSGSGIGHLGGEDGKGGSGSSSGGGVNGVAAEVAVLGAILAGRAESKELARMAVSRMPAANLHMLSMLLHRDPALLHALGTSPQVDCPRLHRSIFLFKAQQSCCIALRYPHPLICMC